MSNGLFFNDDWLDLQRNYWDQWTRMSRTAMGLEGTERPSLTQPWEAAMEQWWKALSPAAPDASRAFMDKLFEQGKTLFRLGEDFANSGKQDPMGAWTRALDEMRQRFSGSLEDSDQGLRRMMSFWELPFDNWQRMMSSMSPLPGDVLRNMPHDQLKERIDQALSAPGLGYTREEQGQYQDLMKRGLDYQSALQEYLAFYSGLGTKSVERMGQFIQSVIDSGKTIDSARALYDAWVSCCESVYAEEVATPEYARIHGALVNAQMALKKRLSIMVDEQLGALNMPSRSELSTLQDRLQETRRENKRLHQSLRQLERQVQALAGGATNPTPPATALKSTPARKTTARKKTAVRQSSTD
ncbi:MAG: class III poly(R)-hydroxyalkanoic acid synthase subunit PhaE [Chromatiaceae bacterium]|nr:class III poly(R)-hydroxyalkanoic acid synthase subunit PhaE [Chromatiaceae bacterium]